jgi:hydroxymethylglutaryl-CoA lyase/(R)-citramalyl-CoA lyase
VSILITDVGPRDGLQNEPERLTPAVRADLCRRLVASGVPRIEAVSFVRDDRVPQMAGAEVVLADLGSAMVTSMTALVLNARGLGRAIAAGLQRVNVAVMATDGFARVNTGMSVDEAIAQLSPTIAQARATGIGVTGTVSVAFGCAYDGPVAPARVIKLAARLVEAGADEVVLADTIGVATPRAVAALVRRATDLGVAVGVHLHDTRNTAIANSIAALSAGATIFESSVGGLGGCPFSPGATGNLATEDLVYAFEGEGVATGIDLDALIGVSRWLEGHLDRRAPRSALAAAGPWRHAA